MNPSTSKPKNHFLQTVQIKCNGTAKIFSLSLLICMVTILFTGCKKNSTKPGTDTEQPGAVKKIYGVGNLVMGDAGGATTQATYWINDSAVVLSTITSFATDIAMSGKDLFITGYVKDRFQNSTGAKVWKNDINTSLYSLPIDGSTGEAIAVSGNNVYFAGLSMNPSEGMQVATVWKNGIATQLSVADSYANTLRLQGSDVFVGGSELINGIGFSATIWKNGSRLFLNKSGSEVKDMQIDGADIHAVGSVNLKLINQDLAPPFAAYWKNGEQTVLSRVPYSLAGSVELIGKDVYIAVQEKDIANPSLSKDKLWKNGKIYSLATGSGAFSLVDLAVADNQLYIAGYMGDEAAPKVWKWENDKLSPVLTYRGLANLKRIIVE